MATAVAEHVNASASESWYERINGEYHEQAMRVFMVVVLGHWVEHLVQGVQFYMLGWPVPEARGVLGYLSMTRRCIACSPSCRLTSR